jgi:hypothetical protein
MRGITKSDMNRSRLPLNEERSLQQIGIWEDGRIPILVEAEE